MVNNKVLLIIPFIFDHAELIGNHYFGLYKKKQKTKKKYVKPRELTAS